MLSTITGVTCLDKLGTGRSQQLLKVETTPETTANLEIKLLNRDDCATVTFQREHTREPQSRQEH